MKASTDFSRPGRRLAAAFVLSLSLLLPAPLSAQQATQHSTEAQALYDDALKQLDAQQYESACRKLEEVTRLAPDGLGAKLTLGKCYEALGKLASAFSQYALVAELAPKMGQSERAEKAAQKLGELKSRLAMLTVDVPKETASIAGLSITRNGVTVERTQWGTPLPVDTGPHEITATAPGRNAWTKRIEVKADGEKVSLAVGRLELPPQARAPAAPPSKPIQEAPATQERPWQRPAGISALVVAGVDIGVGALLGATAISKNNASNDGHCNTKDQCDRIGYDLRQEAVAFGNGSTAAMVIGGVLLAGGIVLLATAPRAASQDQNKQSRRMRGMNASVIVLPGSVQVKGAW